MVDLDLVGYTQEYYLHFQEVQVHWFPHMNNQTIYRLAYNRPDPLILAIQMGKMVNSKPIIEELGFQITGTIRFLY